MMLNIPNLPEHLANDPTKKGVEMLPPPAHLMTETNKLISDAVAQIGKDKRTMLTVWVDTSLGVNAALVSKVNDNVEILGYFGRVWGKPISAGVAMRVSF